MIEVTELYYKNLCSAVEENKYWLSMEEQINLEGRTEKEEPFPIILAHEVSKVLKSVDIEKAVRLDKISNKIMMSFTDYGWKVEKPLTELFNKIVDSEIMPE